MLDEDQTRKVGILIRESVEETNIGFALSDCAPGNLVDMRVLIGEIGAIAAIPNDVNPGVFVIIILTGIREKIGDILRFDIE